MYIHLFWMNIGESDPQSAYLVKWEELNKPSAQAADADPSQCNFTTRKNWAGPIKPL